MSRDFKFTLLFIALFVLMELGCIYLGDGFRCAMGWDSACQEIFN
jgi:hypothetical protein